MRASYGGLFRNTTSSTIVANVGLIESNHVLWTECYALLKGLELAIERGFNELEIAMDSKVIVGVFNHTYDFLWRVLLLVTKIWKIVHGLEHYQIKDIRRELN